MTQSPPTATSFASSMRTPAGRGVTYSERLRELTGEEYERAEHESWTELQTELRRARASPPVAHSADGTPEFEHNSADLARSEPVG